MGIKNAIANLLLAFVLVSIGYALGREATLRSPRPASHAGAAPAGGTAPAGGARPDTKPPAVDHVVVYYFHGTMRCATCNSMERMAREVVHRDFAEQVARGTVRWRVEDYQANEALAKKYDVSTSTVVLARVRNGGEVAAARLDRVWELVHEPPQFQAYIRQSVHTMTQGGAP